MRVDSITVPMPSGCGTNFLLASDGPLVKGGCQPLADWGIHPAHGVMPRKTKASHFPSPVILSVSEGSWTGLALASPVTVREKPFLTRKPLRPRQEDSSLRSE